MIRYALFIPLALILAGCSGMATGAIYTNVIRPHSLDFHDTRIGMKQCIIDSHRIKEPVSGYGISAEWSSGIIQNEARQAGISKITCIDEQTLSVFFGTYKRKRLIVYGY